MEYEVYGEQNLPVQQVGHPSLVKGKAEKKLLPFSKGGVPPRAGRRDQGTGLQKNPLSDSSYREGQKLN
jgi:hypothetical protein